MPEKIIERSRHHLLVFLKNRFLLLSGLTLRPSSRQRTPKSCRDEKMIAQGKGNAPSGRLGQRPKTSRITFERSEASLRASIPFRSRKPHNMKSHNRAGSMTGLLDPL